MDTSVRLSIHLTDWNSSLLLNFLNSSWILNSSRWRLVIGWWWIIAIYTKPNPSIEKRMNNTTWTLPWTELCPETKPTVSLNIWNLKCDLSSRGVFSRNREPWLLWSLAFLVTYEFTARISQPHLRFVEWKQQKLHSNQNHRSTILLQVVPISC